MARKRVLKLRCPICRKRVNRKAADFPFCGERCRLIDLGKWASGGYVVLSPLRDTSAKVERGSRDNDEDA